ncbi:MAG TPA: hypothetical protein VGD43_14245 [Micromonospora sp.]
MALAGGPGDTQLVTASGPTIVWRACLYERTRERTEAGGWDVPVYAHRPDCCEAYGRGADDRCE